MNEVGNTRIKKNQDILSMRASILLGGREKIGISETPETYLTNQGQMQIPKGGLQEIPGQRPYQMVTRCISTNINGVHK